MDVTMDMSTDIPMEITTDIPMDISITYGFVHGYIHIDIDGYMYIHILRLSQFVLRGHLEGIVFSAWQFFD